MDILLERWLKQSVNEWESFNDQIKREIRNAKKEKDAEKLVYYTQAFGKSAVSSFDKFKGSWAHEQWKKEYADQIADVENEFRMNSPKMAVYESPMVAPDSDGNIWTCMECHYQSAKRFNSCPKCHSREIENLGESTNNVSEVAPPNFPKKLYNKIKKQYPGEPEKAYATMWKAHNQMKENNNQPIDLGPDDNTIEEAIQCQNCGDTRSSKFIGKNDRGRDIALCMRCNNKNVRNKLRVQVEQEIPGSDDAEVLDKGGPDAKGMYETSATGAAPGYSTPFAFSGNKSGNEKRRKKTATSGTGYSIVGGQ